MQFTCLSSRQFRLCSRAIDVPIDAVSQSIHRPTSVRNFLFDTFRAIHVSIGYTPSMNGTIAIQATCFRGRDLHGFDFRFVVFSITGITSVDEGIETLAATWVLLHQLFVSS